MAASGAAAGALDGGVARDRASGYLGPVAPGRPDAKRPLPTTAVDAAVDGPPCPACGTTNPPGRRFCRRCATPLHPEASARSAARRRRWQWRGDRSRWLRRLAALLVVVALVVAAWLFHPQALALWEDLRDRLATPQPVAPTSVTASASVADHPAAAAADGLSNRYWGAPAVGDEVEFAFATPLRLLSVVVHAGASAEEDGFVAQARPSALKVVVTTRDGGTHALSANLADQPGPQRTDTGISDVVRVRLTVAAATGLTEGRHIALGEVEFFRRP
ncbi:zinc ribbon domain-containing protein [Actinosynnema sp. NPDC047251]|uniref:NADase-type glycan-binding domain-containing protein n=1 Tax=Saccharothrix espanaensis TaxID=103731 RepID=UPI0018D2A12E|nr:zinc ribbon domain-containing protein [Saccharothrix espanaensis]